MPGGPAGPGQPADQQGAECSEDSDGEEPDRACPGGGGQDREDVLQDREAVVLLLVVQSAAGQAVRHPVQPAREDL